MAELLDGYAEKADEMFVNSDGSPATWVHVYSPQEKIRRTYVPLLLGLAAACFLWLAQYKSNSLESSWHAGLLLAMVPAGLAALWRYQKQSKREYSRAKSTDNRPERWKAARKWFIGAAAMELFGLGIFVLSSNNLNDTWIVFVLPIFIIIPGLCALANRGKVSLTPSALEALSYREHLESEESRRKGEKTGALMDKLMRPWWVRYPLAVAVGYGYFLMLADPKLQGAKFWLISFGALVLVGMLAKEAAFFIIAAAVIGGVGYAIFAGLAALPLGVAIVIGALIIASAIKGKS